METTKNVKQQIELYAKHIGKGADWAARLVANNLRGKSEVAQFIEAARDVNNKTSAPIENQFLMIRNLLDERESPTDD